MSTARTSLDELTIAAFKEVDFKKAVTLIIGLSVAAFAFLIWLIYFKGGTEYGDDSFVGNLPALNAFFNSVSTAFLVYGYVCIRRRDYRKHMRSMLAAFVSSTFFLVSYVIYHNFHGHTVFPGEGTVKVIYLSILFSHIVLSALVVPLILSSFYLAFSGKFALHRKLSRYTFPVWLYVSVTGVVIFFFLRAYA
jgi:putative membrane protein